MSGAPRSSLRCSPGPRRRGANRLAFPSPAHRTGPIFGSSSAVPAAGIGLLKGVGAGCFEQCWRTSSSAQRARHVPSLSFCTFLHSFFLFLLVFSRSLWSSSCSLSLALVGAGSVPLVPHSDRAQKRSLELQAAEPGRKIWSDGQKNAIFQWAQTVPASTLDPIAC